MSAKRKIIVGVAGGSGSGKTNFARKVLEQSWAIGITGQMFSLDNYYRPLGHLNLAKRKIYNFDHPDAIDFERALEQLESLRASKSILQPVYGFKAFTRRPKPRIVAEEEVPVGGEQVHAQ